jgi:hypothetical protein
LIFDLRDSLTRLLPADDADPRRKEKEFPSPFLNGQDAQDGQGVGPVEESEARLELIEESYVL